MVVGLDRDETRELRDRIEDELVGPAVVRAFRRFLGRLERAAQHYLVHNHGLTAAGNPASPTPHPASWDLPVPHLGAVAGTASDDMLTLGTALGWWAEEVGEEVGEAIAASMHLATISRQGTVIVSGVEGTGEYLAKVRDRLVYGRPVHGVTAPVEAFESLRSTIADSRVLGWSRDELALRISQELAWTRPDHGYWTDVRDYATVRLDAILDRYGPPGTPAREYARLHDPLVDALQKERSTAVLRLDADRSRWESRAVMIARTESTGVANYAAMQALAEEGAVGKEWLAALDDRTRDEHAAANGQIVRLGQPFEVGDFHLQFPGDPAAPAFLTINCRCTVVGVEAADMPPELRDPLDTVDDAGDPATWDLSDAEMEERMAAAMDAGDFDTAERIGEVLDARSTPSLPPGIRADDPFTEDTYRWYTSQDETTQARFWESLPENQRQWFEEAAWSWESKQSSSVMPSTLSRTGQLRVARAEYNDWLYLETLRLEEATNGYMVTAEARAKGVTAADLYKVNGNTARAWASEETRRYWDEHGRIMFADFADGKGLATGGQAKKMKGSWA